MAPRPQSTLVETESETPAQVLPTSAPSVAQADKRSNGDSVVISGISGRYPESENMDEFAQNLFNKVDMINDDDRRWPRDLYDMNHRMGKLKEIDKFDGAFFGWRSQIGGSIDPQARILLETTYEAICDSGVNPQTLRGSRTGVYVGSSTIGMPDGYPANLDPTSRTSLTDGMSWVQGTSKAMHANRVSFFFDFRGPSMTIDTACSSSMVALDVAISDIRSGKCDQAIVAGLNINLQPFTNYYYQKLGFNAVDGVSKVWDIDADGFVRGETVGSLFLQRERHSKRVYARVLNSNTNIDGYKKTGMFFPSSDGQLDLLMDTYKQVKIDPNEITYFEAHGTGTKVGDFQEAFAIHRAYCTNGRTKALPIGLLKSNIGHTEAASGVASITKVAIAFENDCIPANLNLKTIKPSIAELKHLKPITNNLPYTPGIAGVNSFGVGGVNGHALLEPNWKERRSGQPESASAQMPRLVLLHGRTKEGVKHLMSFIENNPAKVTPDFLALIAEVFKYKPMPNSSGFPYRGSMLIQKSSESLTYQKSEIEQIGSQFHDELCFFYSGIGGQASALAKDLMGMEVFASKLAQLSLVLKPFGLNLVDLLTSESMASAIEESLVAKFVTTTALQVILTDILVDNLELVPDRIMGHSFGEIAAAYAQGYISAEEAVLISYNRGLVLEQARAAIPRGLMAAVGLSNEEAIDMCPKKVFVACNNADKLVTISGEMKATEKFVDKLKKDGIFVKELDSCAYPLHTPFLSVVEQQLTDRLSAVFASTRDRKHKHMIAPDCLKWTSTCQSRQYMEDLHAHSTNGDFCARLTRYFVENLLKPVNFVDALDSMSNTAAVIEVSGRELFEKLITRAKPSCGYFPLMRDSARTVGSLLTTFGTLYRHGFTPSVERLYPQVEWPVERGTQSISSLLKWEHKEQYAVKLYPDHFFKPTSSDLIVEIDDSNPEYEYLYHHIIDGRSILPGIGLLVFAWMRFAESRGRVWNKLPVQFDDVQLKRPVLLEKGKKVSLKVRLLDPTGEFAVLEGQNVACTGLIKELKEGTFEFQEMLGKFDQLSEGMYSVNKEDIYKDFHVRGYEYGPKFMGLTDYYTDLKVHSYANIQWTGHIIAFLDNLLQSQAPVSPIKELIIPLMLPLIKVNPILFFDAIQQNDISSTEMKENPEAAQLIEDVADDATDAEEMNEIKSKLGKITGEANQVKNADSLIRTYYDYASQTMVGPGIEVSGMTGAVLVHTPHSRPVSVESHQFVPNLEAGAISQQAEVKLFEYEQVCASECKQLLTQFKLDKLSSLVMNGFAEEADEDTKDKYASAKERNALFKILSHSLENFNDENNNCEIDDAANSLDDNAPQDSLGTLLYRSASELAFGDNVEQSADLAHRGLLDYLHTDTIASMAYEERLIRPLIDITSENFASSKELSVLQLSPMEMYPLAQQVDKFLASSTIYKLNIDYVAVHPWASEEQVQLPIPLTRVQWQVKQEPLWPSNLKLKQHPHLAVLYDEPIMQELQLTSSQFWSEMQSTLLQSAFVVVLLRNRYTPLEKLMYESIFKVKVPTEEQLKQRLDSLTTAAASARFVPVGFRNNNLGHCAVLLRKSQAGENVVHKVVSLDQDEDSWLRNVQSDLKSATEGNEARIWLLGEAQTLPGLMGFFNCIRREPGGQAFRLLYLPDGSKGEAAQMFERHRQTLTELDLAVNIFKEDAWGTYRHLSANVLRGTRLSTEYQLNFDLKGDLTNLSLFDSTSLRQVGYVPERGQSLEKKYAVYSSALNFRDVMFVSGRNLLAVGLVSHNCIIGTEFAGRDYETGARVFGMCKGGSFASSIYEDPVYVRPMPDHWSYDEAVGTLTTYFTVWYGLIYLARLEPGSTVLIHSAAGGVGQAALYVCKAYGCTIFATAGSEEKRKFLHSQFGIPSEHIFNSRDSHFEPGIRRLTRGMGVKYVLNSLIGEQLDASLRLVAENGHFVELAKFEMQLNKRIGLFPFLRNVTYHGLAIEYPLFTQHHIVKAFFDWLLSNCGPNQAVQPITSEVFDIENAAAAFKHMTTGKHKGKIILRFREEDDSQHLPTNAIPDCKPLNVQTKTYFDPHKSYIIVGGCGGVGLELAHWLVRKGAKRIVLTSRSAQRTPYQALSLDGLGSTGQLLHFFKNRIQVYTEDISSEQGVHKLLSEVEREAPVGGIFHLAAVLNDTLLENMTPTLWRKTVDAKATLGTLLDKVSRDICAQLDYFVCFSSVTAGRGTIGQTNYGYANSVLDRICERRRSDGLHGLCLQYGPIGDVGMLRTAQDLIAKSSTHFQRIASCLDVLDRAMQTDCAVVSSLVFVDRSHQDSKSGEDNLLKHLWASLGIDPDTIADHVTLGELGMESMFAIEIQQTLEQEFGLRLTLPEIKLITVGELKNNKKHTKEYLQNATQFKKYLLEVNLSLSTKPTEPLNSLTEGSPIFMLPSLLGNVSGMQSFAEKVHFPMVALNITSEVNKCKGDIKSAAKYYMDLLRKQYPNIKRFNLLGLDYGAMVAMKMARKGFPCRVAVIDLKQSMKHISTKDEKLYDQLIEFMLKILLEGAFSDLVMDQNTKDRLLKAVRKEVSFDGKVKSIGQEIHKLLGNDKTKLEELEEVIGGSLRRAQAMLEYDKTLSQKKEKLTHRLLGKLGKAHGRFLVIKDLNASGLVSNYFIDDLIKDLENDSPINLTHEKLTLNSAAELVNKFFES